MKKIQAVEKKAPKKKVNYYGEVSNKIDCYEPIIDFNPKKAPKDYIVVMFNQTTLDEMLRKMFLEGARAIDIMTLKGVRAIGIPCRKLK